MKIEEVIEKVKKELYKQLTCDFANSDLGEAEIIANSINIIQSNLEAVLEEQNELIRLVIENIKSYCFVSDKKIKNAEFINYNKSLCDKNCRIPFIEKIKGKKWEEILKDGK